MSTDIRKITISLPADLLEFADRLAVQIHTSRSQVITQALATARTQEEERLAIAGYRFYAGEATEFAQASAQMSAEAINAPSNEVPNGETW
jgi:metal-responsive CopG/Arc/MetJ family transcriptional regulator